MAYISFQPNDYFNTKLYTGNGGNQTITGVGFQPDWVWFKARDAGQSHALVDIVRGTDKVLFSESNAAQGSISSQTFNSDGFALVQDGTANSINSSGSTKVAWSWKAGGGQGSSNTDGSINTTYTSVNTTSGFSISTYTGTGSNATIGHGLGAVPNVVLVKRTDATSDWRMYHSGAGAGSPATKQLFLNTTGAEDDDNTIWNDTAPTSSVFTVGTNAGSNASGGTYVAYCFSQKSGFSSMGSYTGNGNADGVFVYTGFKPAFFLWKRSNSTGGWYQMDSVRDTYNPVEKTLGANDASAESAFGTGNDTDFCSNGLKIRSTGGDINTSGGSYIFMAFAESPLVSSNGIPNTAR